MASGPKKPNDSFLDGLESESVDPFEEDDGLDFSVEDFLPEEDTAKFVRKSAGKKAWDGILSVFRLPEILLGKIYRASPIRWLLMKFEWYRDLADQSELGSIIEDTYGGPRGVLFRLQRFFRHNILFTCLTIAGVYVGGRAVMPMFFEQEAVRSALGVEEFDADSKISEIKQANQQAKEILNRRTDIKEELQACVVTDKTREAMLGTIGENGFLENENTLKAMSAVRRFGESFEARNFQATTDSAGRRIAALNSSLSAPLANARNLANAIKPANAQLLRQGEQLQRELSNLEAQGSRDIRVVNEVIRVKDELLANRDLIESGPSDADVDMLLERLATLAKALTHSNPDSYQSTPMEEPLPQWYQDFIGDSDEIAVQAAERFDELGIQRFTAQFGDPSRAIVGDAVFQLAGLVDQALTGVRTVKHAPAVVLGELIKEEHAVNKQINRVMETSDEVWVDHRPCLAEQGIAIDVSVLE